jgi:hypothetical protein
MRGVPLNLTGLVFGRLTAMYRLHGSYPGGARWVCECKCGAHHITRAAALTSGHATSCGCLRDEMSAERMRAKWLEQKAK